MSKDLTKANKNKGIAKDQALWLLNLDNGRIFPWTPLLAVRKHFVDCTADGRPIHPDQVPGNHPWIREQTKGLRDRMVAAGAEDDTLQDFGRQLTEDAAQKFKALEFEKAVMQLQNVPAYTESQVGASIRIQNKIDRRVAEAKAEINDMVFAALLSHGFTTTEAYQRAYFPIGDRW